MASNGRSSGGQPARTLTVQDVADYFLIHQEAGAERITNKRLQKLVYLAQGTTLALLHRSLWDTEDIGARITAWEEGPVVPALYRAYRNNRWHDLPIPSASTDTIGPIERAMLDAVLDTYGGLTTKQLTALTHTHDPWVQAWAKTREAEATGKTPLGYDVIPEGDIADYFTRMWISATDPRSLRPTELAAAIHAQPGHERERAEAMAQVDAGQGMGLGDLRRFLDL
jgi:uncharacterized phage-associated protein